MRCCPAQCLQRCIDQQRRLLDFGGLPKRRTRHHLSLHSPTRCLPTRHRGVCCRGQSRICLTRQLDPLDPASRAARRGRRQRSSFKTLHQRWRQHIPSHLDRRPGVELLAQLYGDAFGSTTDHFVGRFQAKKLLHQRLACMGRLPEQKVARLVDPCRSLRGEQAASAQTPEPARACRMCAQPNMREHQVIHPAVPVCVRRSAAAIAAAMQIDLQHRVTGHCHRTCLQRCHPTRLVHLLGKRMNIHHSTTRCCPLCRMKQAEALASLGR